MDGFEQGVPYFARTRRALLASLLALGLVAVWAGVVFAQGSQSGPQAYVDSATDDGGGRIRIAWSLEAKPPEGYYFSHSLPGKVCVDWRVVESGVRGPSTETCFTSEISNQSDLVVDTGIGADGPTTVFSVMLVPYYVNIPLWPHDDGVMRRTEVTLNASS
ncbi:MAG: hypothetical protein OXQ29_06865 [Rhodospirillaceae bacterium]|nr:hypothetical protein [Rhodospirillaceae bacterium]